MRSKPHHALRSTLAFLAFAFAAAWSLPARADVTITGVVGEYGIVYTRNNGGSTYGFVRFKLTDANQTATCMNTDSSAPVSAAGYAYWNMAFPTSREWFTEVLLSKKGTPMVITLLNNTTGCQVTSITVP